MYYLWKHTTYGLIRVSYSGLYDFVLSTVRSKLRLYSVTLEPSGKKEHAELTLVFSEEEGISLEKKRKIEEHIATVLKPMGLKASIIWASPERGISELLQNPYFWAVSASCLALVVTAGFEGFFWTVFWGMSVWFVLRGMKFVTERFR